MAFELPDGLITAQRVADEKRARVLELQDRYGSPTQEGGWSEEQHAEWETAWAAWQAAAEAVQAAVTQYAEETGLPRNEVEFELKRIVRHPEPEA